MKMEDGEQRRQDHSTLTNTMKRIGANIESC
jgi:hypothetical protein